MQPKIAVDIIARDKTEAGRKAAERSLGGFSKKTQQAAREGGLDRLGRQIEGLQRFRTLSFGFDAAGRSLVNVGGIARDTSGAVSAMTRSVLTFGGAAPLAFQKAATGAAAATGAVAGLAAAVAGLAVGTYLWGDRWAKIGQDLGNRAKDLGMSPQALQARRGAAERYGVSADQTDGAIEGLGDTLYNAKYGGDNLALGVLNQLGLKIKEDGAGNIDTDAMLGDIADAIARQKNPAVQKKLAQIFGVQGMLPALRQGSAALSAEGSDYMASGAALTDAQVAQAEDARRKSVRLRQQLGAIEKAGGVAAMGAVGPMADAGVAVLRGDGAAVKESAGTLVEGATVAAEKLVEGAAEAGGAMNPLRGLQHFLNRFQGPKSFDALGREMAGAKAAGLSGVKADRAAQALAYFQSMGWSPAQASGLVANIAEESGFDPNIVGDGGRAFGLAQWHPDRQANFKAWSGKDIRKASFEDQLAFMHHELTAGSERAAGARLRGASSGAEAGAIVSRYYERPRDRDGEAADRARLAKKIEVAISLRGAPAGTTASVRGADGEVAVAMNVARGMEGP